MTDLHTRAEAIAADANSIQCSSLFWSLRHELLAVVRQARTLDRALGIHHLGYDATEPYCQEHADLRESLTAYDLALKRELGNG